ncbi:hypothetical protein [Bowmanella dokdonensis]|uniref:Uncharacterized protein n=1 Tax=Bowmanella dokdonensis TaxID=751969 RepID=A0A939IR36_9ALTE|nr:hypothetical protein [Bowmanella dokdonensis]MBN7827565.1 hypothetical protein [Bowmanella dokdonensis]
MTKEQDLLTQLQAVYANEAENLQDLGFSQQVLECIQQKKKQRRDYWLAVLICLSVLLMLSAQWLLPPASTPDWTAVLQSLPAMAVQGIVGLCVLVWALE